MAGIEQAWILDRFLEAWGLDVLHPESQPFWEWIGYDHHDYRRVCDLLKARSNMAKSWATVAQEAERKAKYNEERGLRLTAGDLYLRAALNYGRARYTYFRDDPRKTAFHNKMQGCYDKVIQYTPNPIEKVEIPFQGKTIYADLHLPANANKVPCVIVIPGLDMFKEEWHYTAQRCFLPRGMAAIAIDGPGQGESLLKGLKVTIDNYDRAGKAVIDYLVTRPEINPEKIVLYGFSWASFLGPSIAAYDERVKACAVAMGGWGLDNPVPNFIQAQPSFRVNFMYVTGIDNEAEVDEKYVRHLHMREIAPKVKCPILLAHGEFDELFPLEGVMATYELIQAPKELWIYEEEFHPLGGVARECFSAMADWLVEMLGGSYDPSMDNRFYIGQDGTHHKGTGKPLWWLV